MQNHRAPPSGPNRTGQAAVSTASDPVEQDQEAHADDDGDGDVVGPPGDEGGDGAGPEAALEEVDMSLRTKEGRHDE